MTRNQILIETINQTFEELMGNGSKYLVPRFQRDYSWDQEQWEDLWTDIEELQKEGSHYMGYVVLQKKEKHLYEIIDGQQRFITLTLIILASMGHLRKLIDQGIDSENNEERLKEIEKRFIGAKNLITLNVENRLTLNRNNNRFFKGICSNLEPPNPRGITKTNDLLRKTFEFFLSKINYPSGDEIAKFIELFTSSLIFTKIVVQDRLNAYKVFETLNARGVMLSTPDLIKNYLFSVVTKDDSVSDADLDDMDQRWSMIVTQLGEQNFTDFVRNLYNSQFSHTTKKDLFNSIRKQYSTPQKTAAYLKNLEKNAPLYASLLSPYDEWWNTVDTDYKQAIPYLEGLILFSIHQPLVVLLAAYAKFTVSEFIVLAKYLFVLSVRYNIICNDSPNEQEKKINQMALKIFNNEYKRASHVKNGEEFKKLYPSDERFQRSFQFFKMPSRESSRKIRFLLSQIEIQIGREMDFEKVSLEHVCPYNPNQEWQKAFGEGVNEVFDRLGNMVLLDKDELQRATFLEKQKVYLASGSRLAQEVAKYKEWNLASLNKYQDWLASQAVITWRVD